MHDALVVTEVELLGRDAESDHDDPGEKCHRQHATLKDRTATPVLVLGEIVDRGKDDAAHPRVCRRLG